MAGIAPDVVIVIAIEPGMMRGNFQISSAFVLRTMMEGMSCNAGSDCISHDPD